ncbi:MAG: hypothetical protein IT269_14120, partial [Saprospiraceae bacterium]|nr:hypothetical protein [Saprospiraceae bacterium]
MKQFFTLFLFTLVTHVLYSQPADLQRYGCRFAHQHLNHLPLTAERQAAQAASNARSDTFDILHYRIFTDLTETTAKTISGNTEVFFSPKLPDIGNITLDLLALTVDSVQTLSGQPLAYTHQGLSLKITLQEALAVGDTGSLRVFYHGKPIQSTSNFGGVYFDAGYIYNLSIGLNDDPHNFGHAWFPCFDNFQERSTYEMSFMTVAPYRAYAVGDFVSEFPIGPNRSLRSYKMDLPLATYQVSFAAANYGEVKGNIEGAFGDDIPLLLLSKLPDTNKVKTAFLPYIGDAVRGFELWYGRHTWNRVGYAMTTRGAMENPGNIIYPDFLIQPANLSTHLEIMSHELAHHWWGDVVTVGSESDMWIKEGPAEYGSHQFFEYIDGKNEFIERLRANTHTVLKNAHYDDGGFLPLSPMPHEVTYGTHTYNKGAMVMHNLRAYLGDSLFASGMQHLQEAFRFDNMNAYEMRDTLSAFTGVDLTDFYEDCVFSPGFTDIDVETVTLAPNNNTPGHFYATVKVRQQVRAAPHLYHNVPVEVNFRSATGQTADFSMVVPAEEGVATFDVPFEPAMTYLNGSQRLNTACIAFDKVAKTT